MYVEGISLVGGGITEDVCALSLMHTLSHNHLPWFISPNECRKWATQLISEGHLRGNWYFIYITGIGTFTASTPPSHSSAEVEPASPLISEHPTMNVHKEI